MTVRNTRYNPFLHCDPEELAARIVALMPSGPERSPEEEAAFEAQRAADKARYHEARWGALPADTYRILDQGSFMGWHYQLEVGGETPELVDAENGLNEFQLHGNLPRAVELARQEVARRFGAASAARASFRVIFGGQL